MVKGQAATLGFISFLKKPNATKNSSLVDMLLEGGAVLYVKTNVPQTLFVSCFLLELFTFYFWTLPETC